MTILSYGRNLPRKVNLKTEHRFISGSLEKMIFETEPELANFFVKVLDQCNDNIA